MEMSRSEEWRESGEDIRGRGKRRRGRLGE